MLCLSEPAVAFSRRLDSGGQTSVSPLNVWGALTTAGQGRPNECVLSLNACRTRLFYEVEAKLRRAKAGAKIDRFEFKQAMPMPAFSVPTLPLLWFRTTQRMATGGGEQGNKVSEIDKNNQSPTRALAGCSYSASLGRVSQVYLDLTTFCYGQTLQQLVKYPSNDEQSCSFSRQA